MAAAPFNISLGGLELLVVEDDATSALLISRALSLHGARVETASNGIEGLAKFREKRFPVIITDINMPGMSGLELVRRIREYDRDTQIIAASANRETDSLVTAIELDFSEYLFKPIEIDKLLMAVKRCGDIAGVKRQLENEREKFRTVVECLGEGITIKDLDYRILYQNRAMTEMTGDRTGLCCYEIFGRHYPCTDCPTVKALADGKTHSACRSFQHNGATVHVESTASLLRDTYGAVTGSVEITRNISERIRNEQIIRDMAFHDPLTGLANRRLFQDRLEQAIAKSRRYDRQFGLITLDLDYFKSINDTFGHDAGDRMLQEAAERIRGCCKRDLDTIGRLGGDEFGIIFTDCGGREQLAATAAELLEQFTRPVQLAATPVTVTASIGISIFPDDGTDMKALAIASDQAMYAAKKAGRNCYRFREPEIA